LWSKVRGFHPHPVHFFLLYNYGIVLNSILASVGQIQQQYLSDRKNSDEIFDIAKSYISARPDALDKLKESYLTKMLPHLALRVILQLHY
jgi:hypothetical protein